MGNYWLELNNRVVDEDETVKSRIIDIYTEAMTHGPGPFVFNEVTNLYKAFPNNKIARDEFVESLYWCASGAASYLKGNVEKEDAMQECVIMGLDKVKRFDPEKGRAFNFFTTCMMGHLRQLYRNQEID